MEPKALGEVLKTAREQNKITRKAAAEQIGLSDKQLKLLESGTVGMEGFDEFIDKILDLYGLIRKDIGLQSEFEIQCEALREGITVEHSDMIQWIYEQEADRLAGLFIQKGVGGSAKTIADHICNKFLANAKLPQLREIALHSVASDEEFYTHVHDIVFERNFIAAKTELESARQLELPFDEDKLAVVADLDEKRNELKNDIDQVIDEHSKETEDEAEDAD